MASSLDLHEQEQLDSLKAFWRQYGNLITFALALGFAVVAGINGWNLWQGKQAENAAARVDQLEAAVQAGDATRAQAIFDDIRNNFARTSYAAQAGLSTAKLQVQKALPDDALKSLAWVADNAAPARGGCADGQEAVPRSAGAARRGRQGGRHDGGAGGRSSR